MNLRHKIFGLGAALALGVSAMAPVAAQTTTVGTVDVSVTVTEAAGASFSIGLSSGSSSAFATVNATAVGTAAGFLPAGTVDLSLAITGDDDLERPGSSITLRLGDGTPGGAHMNLTGADPVFLGSDQVDFQIPGRYLSVSGLQNPQQAKYTGSATSTSGAAIWNGTIGRVPRVAGNASVGEAIYKVGDIYGTFNNASDTCRITTDIVVVAWNTACGDASFGEGQISKSIAGIYPGSGFVNATQTIRLALNVPAGVYPGTYTGTLTLEQTVS